MCVCVCVVINYNTRDIFRSISILVFLNQCQPYAISFSLENLETRDGLKGLWWVEGPQGLLRVHNPLEEGRGEWGGGGGGGRS